jgi:ABC-2 type transport system ATP-binding protein
MAKDAIAAQELAYWYGDLVAVDHINFTVAQGEILGFLGPNGAGKTTTVKMLTGQLKPKAGKAMLLGMDVAHNTEEVQAEMGVCFEDTNLYERMNALENLILFARLFGVKSFDAYALLKRVGLAGREKDRVGNYSKGMKQRLMVARSLVSRPATIFLTTHDMMEADKLCDRVAFMNQGKIVALDTPHNLKQQYGKRALRAKVSTGSGKLESREITMDTPETPAAIQELFTQNKVVTIHSEEASLENIFIKLTGRRLTE